ncbi:hypothetical protein [Bradyrhizobium canariense]|uniref:hypothetical protein n=1 Tax=Bradyrhizobium canariense TaxID=255045 RepID=UPI001FCD80E7|nr:hypothetical protein [Bradyrhizobium canariense]
MGWADRTKRLAARVPDLDIFSYGLDIELAVQPMELAGHLDQMILFSGDLAPLAI